MPWCGGEWARGSLRVRGPSGGCGSVGERREWYPVWELGGGHVDGEERWTWRQRREGAESWGLQASGWDHWTEVVSFPKSERKVEEEVRSRQRALLFTELNRKVFGSGIRLRCASSDVSSLPPPQFLL